MTSCLDQHSCIAYYIMHKLSLKSLLQVRHFVTLVVFTLTLMEFHCLTTSKGVASSPQSAFFAALSTSLWSKNCLYLNIILCEDTIWAEFGSLQQSDVTIKAFQKLIIRNIWRNPERRKAHPISGLPPKSWHHIWSASHRQIHQCHKGCFSMTYSCILCIKVM